MTNTAPTILGSEPKPRRKPVRADLRTAFRRRVQFCHPDRGGDPAAFRRLVEARDRALARC